MSQFLYEVVVKKKINSHCLKVDLLIIHTCIATCFMTKYWTRAMIDTSLHNPLREKYV